MDATCHRLPAWPSGCHQPLIRRKDNKQSRKHCELHGHELRFLQVKSTGQRSNSLPSQVQSRTNCTTTVPGIQVHNRISGASGSSHPTCSSGRTVRPRNQGIRLKKGKRRLDSRPFSSQRSTAHIHETRGFGYNSSRGCTAITRDSASSPTRRHGVLGRLHRRNWC